LDGVPGAGNAGLFSDAPPGLALLLRLISAVGAGAYRCGLGYGGCDDGFGAVIAIDGMHKMASISAAGMNKVLSYLALKNGGLEL